MGECGCAQDVSEYRIKGADGYHYGIGLYSGCSYCHTPLGLDIFRYNDQAANDVALETVPEAAPPGDDYYAALGHPILDPEALLAALVKQHPEFDLDLHDVRAIMEEAFHATQTAWHQETQSRHLTRPGRTDA